MYFNIKNLNLKDEMKRLSHTAEKSFLVKRHVKNVVYELRILKIRIYKTFNANSLTKTDSVISMTKKLEVRNKEKKYEVNKILSERKIRKRTEFLIN